MRNMLPTEERLKSIPFPDPSVNLIDTPVEVIFKIPEKVYVGEDATSLKIGVWDSETQAWSTDFIGQITKEGENKKDPRQVHFTTTKFAPIAFLQSRCMDYPYQNWWLRCIEDETALLDVWTKRIRLTFEIGALYIKLIDNTIPELSHLLD